MGVSVICWYLVRYLRVAKVQKRLSDPLELE